MLSSFLVVAPNTFQELPHYIFFETGSHDRALAALQLYTDQAGHKLKESTHLGLPSASPSPEQPACPTYLSPTFWTQIPELWVGGELWAEF